MKKNRLLCLSLIGLMFATYSWAKTEIEDLPHGKRFFIQEMRIDVQFYSPNIVRITKTPINSSTPVRNSLSVIKGAEEGLKIECDCGDNACWMEAGGFEISIDSYTGHITFYSGHGKNMKKLFAEKEYGAEFTPTKSGSRATYEVRQGFLLDKDEVIYGLGQQQNGKMNQRFQKIYLDNENTRVCIPFFLSEKGYGVFWDNYSPTVFNDNQQGMSFTSEVGDCIDYYFMMGEQPTLEGVIAQMRNLTGQAPLFPVWSYGFWQSKERYKTQDEVVDVLKQYRDLQIPIDGMVQDWQYWGEDTPEMSPKTWNAMKFDATRFPNPQKFVDDIHNLNGKLMIVAWPGFGKETEQFKVFSEKNYMVNFTTWSPNAQAKPYDVFNKDARDLYWDYLNKGVFVYGIDGWWLDSTEPDHINKNMPKDYDQPTAMGAFRDVHNAFPLMHTTGIYDHQRATSSDKRVLIMTRSAFAGQQRNGANTWSGDVNASWETLRRQVTAGLNFSMCGIPHWNTDIGGFFLWDYRNPLNNDCYKELFIRWLQFGVVSPMMRVHGTDAPKEIFRFGKPGDWTYDAYAKAIKLRYSLIPYIYATSWEVTRYNGTFMRALAFDFAQDRNVLDIGDEYMFGKQLLAAPVVEQLYTHGKDPATKIDFATVKSRRIYLPKGCGWYDYWTNDYYEGGQTLSREVPIDLLPLYAKAGAIIPIGPDVQYVQEKSWKNLEIRLYAGADGNFILYEDEGNNYNYEKGEYSEIPFSWDDANRTLTIANRNGSYKGMNKSRKFEIILITPNQSPVKKSISYKGKEVKVKL